ncbi:hypothetical protein CLI64_20860 [Nostoc sp. CENA543]|uniref:hypothetical protein n=1 Tax=Nostoc sp. CENA543 TaxID=1869241 RepID=UPI000CA0FFC0|nr:hypothetical protein [Nostoc sp. CENA543]AUT02647.1 hypothetical protein CLI64_20860 [Nostoc sp. CENA543]
MVKPVVSNLAILAFILVSFIGLTQQLSIAEKKNPSNTSWFNISRLLFTKKPPVNPRKGGSRPTEIICMISPDAPNTRRKIWSDRPLFIWQGNVSKVTVKSLNNNQVLWSEPVKDTQHIRYNGEPLKPGQSYKWEVNSNRFITFQIIDMQQRDRITTQLQTIEAQLQKQGANQEAIALAKANYFAEYQLWSDVLQQIYSVNPPSAELNNLRQQITQNLCTDQ